MKEAKPQKILILLHSNGSPAGSLLTWCDERQIPFQLIDMREVSPEVLQSFKFDWLIILGGPQNVDEETKYPWLKYEKDFIRKAIQEDKKVLGLCLGGQLIAEVLGANVGPSPQWEAGFREVEFLSAPTSSVKISPQKIPMFHWHGYSFSLPKEATLIAQNEATPCQGFIFKDQVVGLQFHPETTKHWARYCATDDSDPYPQGAYVQSPEEILSSLNLQEGVQRWFFDLLDQMLSLRSLK